MPSCGARCRASSPDGEGNVPSVGQIEKKTQERVLALLSQRLGYTYLGDWTDRPANSNIEPE